MTQSATGTIPVRRVSADSVSDTRDVLAVEEPLEIRLHADTERPVSITMRTPGHDSELAAGFLFTEGIISSRDDVMSIEPSPFNENVIIVTLVKGKAPQLNRLERNFYTTSSCGVCGKASLDAVKSTSIFGPAENRLTLTSALLHSLAGRLRGHQQVFEQTGGLHASALFDESGNLILVREDVGRHNALDKVIGASLQANTLPLRDAILLLSGRISFELVQKAAMAGIPFVAAIGAPSTLAVALAEENNMTLVGFLRDNRYTIYSGKQRIA